MLATRHKATINRSCGLDGMTASARSVPRSAPRSNACLGGSNTSLAPYFNIFLMRIFGPQHPCQAQASGRKEPPSSWPTSRQLLSTHLREGVLISGTAPYNPGFNLQIKYQISKPFVMWCSSRPLFLVSSSQPGRRQTLTAASLCNVPGVT